jgi:AmmeMemoRadiSam system protein B/AmmeMemoRadiSam system protein A
MEPSHISEALPATDGPPNLSNAGKEAVLRCAAELVAAAVLAHPADGAVDRLGGVADGTVTGCFLTIKRKGQLRGCCGFIGRSATIRGALVEACEATALRDHRLPPLSATELPHVELTVSLLHGMRRIEERGEARAGAVEVGRHGLQIAQGNSRGLLLPVVAVEHGLDADAFLRQVCLKAGLPPTAWSDDRSNLFTFESLSFGGPFDHGVLEGLRLDLPPLLTDDEARRLARGCRDNIVALVEGATPTFYFSNLPDGTVNAVALTLRLDRLEEAPRMAQLSVRPGIPLQATLLELSRMAAGMFRSEGYRADDLAGLHVDLAALYDSALHGTVAAPDLQGIDPGRRALAVVEKNRSAWVFDPAQQVDSLLELAAREAAVRRTDSATVFSFEAVCTSAPQVVATVPKPSAGKTMRPPAVAGSFYPSEADGLAKLLDGLLPASAGPKGRWSAAIVPHAGLVYSGRLAASVLAEVEIPETVIVIGPKHTRWGVEWAVAPHEKWLLPGLEVDSDPVLAEQLASSIEHLQLDAAAHAREHAIEVELPLLARLAPTSRVVGIAIGAASLTECGEFAKAMAQVLQRRSDRTLLVISSDMNHFANQNETLRLDEMALQAIVALDPEGLHAVCIRHQISMCGMLPAVIVMQTLRLMGGLTHCRRVGHTTSAEVTGDTQRVVGYAGMLLR